jgi:hypothetical protein
MYIAVRGRGSGGVAGPGGWVLAKDSTTPLNAGIFASALSFGVSVSFFICFFVPFYEIITFL